MRQLVIWKSWMPRKANTRASLYAHTQSEEQLLVSMRAARLEREKS